MSSLVILGCSKGDYLDVPPASKYLTKTLPKYYCPRKTVREQNICLVKTDGKLEQYRRIANARGRHIKNVEKVKNK